MYSPCFLFSRLQALPVRCVLFLEMCFFLSWLCSTWGFVGNDLTTVSPGGKKLVCRAEHFWGVNTQTIADFRLAPASLSEELGRNVCNWLCKLVWVASAHPWLHLSAWIADLPGSLLWLQPAGHTHDTLRISLLLLLCTLTYFSISTSVSSSVKTGITGFPLSFWHIAQCVAHSCYSIRVYGMSKSSFLAKIKDFFPSAGSYCLLFLAVRLIQTTYWSSSSGLVDMSCEGLLGEEFGQDGKWLESWFSSWLFVPQNPWVSV